MRNSIDALKDQLRDKGYKLTPQRKAILETILESPGHHMSTEEVYDIVRKRRSDIGLATVYRTLMLLSDLKVLSKINFEDGCVRYEACGCVDDHQHHHLICKHCGKIIEVEDLLDDLETRIEKEYDFKIMDHRLKFIGYCSDCKKTL